MGSLQSLICKVIKKKKEGYDTKWAYPLFNNSRYSMSVDIDDCLQNIIDVVKDFLKLIRVGNTDLYNLYNPLPI